TIAPLLSSATLKPEARAMIQHRLEVQSRILRDEDLSAWDGWWRRHSDRVTFLGDHMGCHAWFLYAFDAMLLGGLVAVIRRQPQYVETTSVPQMDRRSRRRARRRKR